MSASVSDSSVRTAETQRARRIEALSYHLAGLSWGQIAERMGISDTGAKELVDRTLEAAERHGVDEMREVENQRLDRAQTGIWADVLKGDHKAIALYLRLSDHRAKLNGLYAPQKLDIAMSVRHELREALNALDDIVLPILDAEVIEDAVTAEEEVMDERAVDALFRPADQHG